MQADVDHIIAFSRSLDYSFANRVICHSACNRAKGDRTSFEAYAGDEARHEAIRDRAGKVTGDRRAVAQRLRRFAMNEGELEEFLQDFRNRQLNDTAYAARLAA